MKIIKYLLVAILFVLAFSIAGCVDEVVDDIVIDDESLDTEIPVGGDELKNCDLANGYTLCPSLNSCVRVWEAECDEYIEYYREPSICTREYMPVLGEMKVPADGEVHTVVIEFSNRCVAESAGAKNIVLLNQYEEIAFEDLPEDKYEACELLDGTALEQFNECEFISQEACDYLGGNFYECESACRNDPDAEMCIMMCVPVCKFK